MTTRAELTTKITQLRNEITKAEQKVGDFEKLTPAQELATEIHKAFCQAATYDDGCMWGYEKKWDAYNHDRYLKKAIRILQITDLKTAVEVIGLIKSF